MREQRSADTTLLISRPYIRMTNQRDIRSLLDPHHAKKLPAVFIPPERNALIDLTLQFLLRHIRFVKAICWNDAAICLGAIVDNLPNCIELFLSTSSDLPVQ